MRLLRLTGEIQQSTGKQERCLSPGYPSNHRNPLAICPVRHNKGCLGILAISQCRVYVQELQLVPLSDLLIIRFVDKFHWQYAEIAEIRLVYPFE